MKPDKIKTDRLLLRHFKEDDAQAIFDNWAKDPEVTKYMSWNPHENVGVTQYILNIWLDEYLKPDTHRFGITLRDTGELIGGIDVVRYIDKKPEIGYCLSKKYWNNGYMTEACTAFMEYLFDQGYKEILIEAEVRNIGSNRVIEKCGFTFTHKETRLASEMKPVEVTVKWYRKKAPKK